MAVREAVGDLEVLEAAPPRKKLRPMGRRRHWPAVLAAMALVGFVLAVPVRVTLAKAEFLRLQQRWTRAEALTTAYATALDRLRRQATAEDADAVARITRTLDREQAAALRELRSAVVSEHTPDAAVASLRREIGRSLSSRIAALDAGRDLEATPLAGGGGPVAPLLSRTAHRFHQTGPDRPLITGTFAIGDGALAPISRYLDHPTGDRVVAVNRGTFTVADIDASRTTTTHLEAISRRLPFAPLVDLSARDGYIAVISGDGVFAAPTALDGPARLLGRADLFFPALRPDAVWLVSAAAGSPETTMTEVNGSGAVLAGPFHGTELPIAELAGGRFLADAGHAAFSIWTPAAGGPSSAPLPFAGSALAWSVDHLAVEQLNSEPPQMHLVSLPSAAGSPLTNIAIENPPGLRPAELCRFSGDGATVACLYQPDNSARRSLPLRLGLIDVANGHLQMVDGLAGDAPALGVSWSPRDDRVYVSSVAGHPLAAYTLGDDRLHQVRLTGTTIQQFVVLPSPGS